MTLSKVSLGELGGSVGGFADEDSCRLAFAVSGATVDVLSDASTVRSEVKANTDCISSDDPFPMGVHGVE